MGSTGGGCSAIAHPLKSRWGRGMYGMGKLDAQKRTLVGAWCLCVDGDSHWNVVCVCRMVQLIAPSGRLSEPGRAS